MTKCIKSTQIFLVTIFVLVLVGCATTAKYRAKLATWDGKDVNQLIDAWGYPDNTIKSPEGNEVYVYKYHSAGRYPRSYIPGNTTVNSSGGNTYVSTSPGYYTGGGTYNNNCTTWFELNKDNKIVRAVFRGNNCVSD